jgi:hypothetical protein
VRRRGKTRPRILYWFRTPPGVRVGRAAIDEEAIRQIEVSNPGMEFDWPQILKGQEGPPEAGEPPRRPRDRASARPAGRPAHAQRPTGPAGPAPSDDATSADEAADEVEVEAAEAPPPEPSTPAEARLGSQGLARLRARYAELLTRIADRVPEPERQDQLKELAERLNPDAWITDADVTAGLDAYEPTYEMVRSSLPPRRKPGEPV